MDRERSDRPAREALDGYVSGHDAPIRAAAAALAAAESARSVVLVEGLSDQIAVETLAIRLGRDLAAESVVVVPIGGAHAIARYLTRFGPHSAGRDVAGLCDAAEEKYFRRGMTRAGRGRARRKLRYAACSSACSHSIRRRDH